jgi:hypothetical protein
MRAQQLDARGAKVSFEAVDINVFVTSKTHPYLLELVCSQRR